MSSEEQPPTGDELLDNVNRGRFEFCRDGELVGWLSYSQPEPSRYALQYTEVDADHRHQGVGGAMVRRVLDEIRARQGTVTAICPFVADYLSKTTTYVDLVAPRHPGVSDQANAESVRPKAAGETSETCVGDLSEERYRGSTTWTRGGLEFLRGFLGDRRSGTFVLGAAMVFSLSWANIAQDSYRSFWSTEVEVAFGTHAAALSVRELVNQGLMTFFFLVVGLEARREWDLGDLRDRRRSLLPLSIGLTGLILPALIFVFVNLTFAGGSPHAWGTAMSTDTAMALGALSLLERSASPRVRQFLITVLVADDIGSLFVIAAFYSGEVRLPLVGAAAAAFVLFWWLQRARVPWPLLVAAGSVGWLLTRTSGIDPIIGGLVIGLLAPAYAPALGNLEHATLGMRSFREQPTPSAARTAIAQLRAALSPNAKLLQHFALFVSLLVVPLFVVANLGIQINTTLLHRAFTDPITWGILGGLLVGKPAAYALVPWVVRALTRGRLMPPVAAGEVLTAGVISSMGFTVTVLVATKALTGTAFDDAVVGALAALLIAPLLAVAWARVPQLLPSRLTGALLKPGAPIVVDLVSEVDDENDHVRGRPDAGVTIVEYGDFECPYCGQAEESLTEVLHRLPAQVRYVWRHLPLVDVHPAAWRAALASEAAAAQDAFWPMHDALLAHRAELEELDLVDLAASLGLDSERFVTDFEAARTSHKVVSDIESARLSGVAGTPTLFINGVRHEGDYGPAALLEAVHLVVQPGSGQPLAGRG
jgi:Na+/H+ antiporter NhaA/predicted DsbA family dithiol-disulfide isomerase/predicted GNAT family acetyltransferase